MVNRANGGRFGGWMTWVAAAGLGLLVLAVFQAVRDAALLTWDDNTNIEANWRLRSLSWENIRWMFTDTHYTRRYLPLAWLDWAIDARLFGLTPRSCHVGNVLLHVANTWLVGLVIREVIRRVVPASTEVSSRVVTAAAAIGAAFWAVHPLRVEVVAWASGRIYGQTTFFLLLSMLAYLRAGEHAPGSWSRRRWLWASAAALGLSLLTYPLAVSFVAVLVLLDRALPASSSMTPDAVVDRSWRRVGWEMVPFIAVTAAVAGVTLWARLRAGGAWEPPPTLAQFSLLSRLMQACYIWAYFLWKPIVPLHLSPVYPTLYSFDPLDAPFVASLGIVTGMTALVIWRRRQWPGLFVIWCAHLILLVPMLGLTEHPHYANDRYSHLVSIPWAAGLAVCIVRVWPAKLWRIIVVSGAGVAIGACGFASAAQTGIWRDSETLFRYLLNEMAGHPYRADIAMRLGDVLKTQGRLTEAERYLRESLQIWPSAPWALNSLANTLELQGRLDEAVAQYQAALQLKPDLPPALQSLGRITLQANRPEEAARFFSELTRVTPGDPAAWEHLGEALRRLGRVDEACAQYETALRLAPSSFSAHIGLGAARLAAGHPREAAASFTTAVQLMPDSPIAHHNLGVALRAEGNIVEARKELERALQLQPDFAPSRQALDQTPQP